MSPQRIHFCSGPASQGRKPPAAAAHSQGARPASDVRKPDGGHPHDTRLQLMASMNHEIRTPLSGILGMVDLLLETKLDEEQRGYVRAAQECAQTLFELLNTTLEYTSITAGGIQLDESEFEVADLLTSVVHEARRRAESLGVKLHWAGPGRLPRSVIGDGYRVRQVFNLLLSTALRLTPSGGLFVEASEAPDPGADRTRIALCARSSAIHLPDWQLEELMQAGGQTDMRLASRFSDLGLSISLLRRLLELMGGQLTLETGPESTELIAEVPLLSRTPAAIAADGLAELAGAEPRILVVDDNRISQRVISAILAKGHHNVDCANDGPSAIEMASAFPYSLVFMDLQMPGMDGLETTAHLRRLPGYDSTPILALTAEVSDDLRLECRRGGMAAFLSKPVHAAELLDAVNRWTG